VLLRLIYRHGLSPSEAKHANGPTSTCHLGRADERPRLPTQGLE
jgi:hypothetical protein